MKKLSNLFIASLALFSLLISSCEKEKPANSNAVFYIRHSYTLPPPNQGSGSGTGNIANGIVNALYKLDPYLHGSDICQWVDLNI